MKIDPNEPAFPAGNLRMQIGDDGTVSPVPGGPNGLTIRAYIAARVMAQLRSSSVVSGTYEDMARSSVLAADALIAELSK